MGPAIEVLHEPDPPRATAREWTAPDHPGRFEFLEYPRDAPAIDSGQRGDLRGGDPVARF
jgi:hypothetical protein